MPPRMWLGYTRGTCSATLHLGVTSDFIHQIQGGVTAHVFIVLSVDARANAKFNRALPVGLRIYIRKVMLLYIGACTDVRPLMRFGHAHTKFIYVDALPDSGYYPKFNTVAKLQEEMVGVLKREKAFQSIRDESNHFVIKLVGGQTLRYFYNTPDTDMFKHKTLSSHLPNVTALHIKGYFPTITQPLPKLRMISHTPLCSPFYAEHKTKLNFDWKSIDRIELPDEEPSIERMGYITSYYMDTCESCGETAQFYESYFPGSGTGGGA